MKQWRIVNSGNWGRRYSPLPTREEALAEARTRNDVGEVSVNEKDRIVYFRERVLL
jgi:hypothetical protein